MAKGFKSEKIDVYSAKYDIHGTIIDCYFQARLCFEYAGRLIEMEIHPNLLNNKDISVTGAELIETYVADRQDIDNSLKVQLHYWYVDDQDYQDGKHLIGHGIVTGHPRLMDSTRIHTSAIRTICIDNDEAILTTCNTVYHCPLAYLDFMMQDANPGLIPNYEAIRDIYWDSIDYPTIERGKVLLVLADFSEYYFHSLYFLPIEEESETPVKCVGSPHIGTFQDSYIICSERIGEDRIDIRYFPHFQNIEFYSENTMGYPLYIENIGRAVIYVKTHAGMIKLAPGIRKEVTAANAEEEKPCLPTGDLYPALIL